MKSKKQSYGSLQKRGNNYYAVWRQDGKVIFRVLRDINGMSITTEPEAQQAKIRLMEIIAKQKKVDALRSLAAEIGHEQAELDALKDAQNPPLKIVQIWQTFLRSPRRKDCGRSTLEQYEVNFTRFVTWMEKEHKDVTLMRQVDSKLANQYLESLNHGKLTASTFNGHLFIVNYVWKTISDDNGVTVNPWAKARRKTSIPIPRRILTVAELKTVIAAASGEMRLLFGLGLYTGMRLGDCSTLKWHEVDLDRRQIFRVPRKIARRCQQAIPIPIHPVLANLLASIPQDQRGEYVLPEMSKAYLSGTHGILTNRIQRHFNECGIQTNTPREGGSRPVVVVGFHSLRSNFVSMCREANAPLAVVEKIVGHHSKSLTQHYTQVLDRAATDAVNLLPSINLN